VRWCPDGTFWRFFGVLHFQRDARTTFQTCILNLHYGHTMCGSMVDIQSATAEIRRGKKKELEMWAIDVCVVPTDSVRRPRLRRRGVGWGVGLWTLTRMCSITQTDATSHNRAKRDCGLSHLKSSYILCRSALQYPSI